MFSGASALSFCRRMAARAAPRAAADGAAPVSRFLWSAWNRALLSASFGLPVRMANTSLFTVRMLAAPIFCGNLVKARRSSLMMAWRVMLNSLP
ncbi:hypothetical protein FQZ97_412780 [compost metagenome]